MYELASTLKRFIKQNPKNYTNVAEIKKRIAEAEQKEKWVIEAKKRHGDNWDALRDETHKVWGNHIYPQYMTDPKIQFNYSKSFYKSMLKGVDEVVIRYYGSGDSGSIESIDYSPKPPANKAQVEAIIEEWAYDKLNGLPDWCNNEGGGGILTIDAKTGDAECSHYQNEEHEELDENEGQVDAEFVKLVRKHHKTAVELICESSESSYMIRTIDTSDRAKRLDNLSDEDSITETLRDIENDVNSGDNSTTYITINLKTLNYQVKATWTETIESNNEGYSFNLFEDIMGDNQ